MAIAPLTILVPALAACVLALASPFVSRREGLVAIPAAVASRVVRVETFVFDALALVFVAAMIGFSFTGDLFNLFVFFELMSVAAYALVGYEIGRRAALEESLTF